MPSNSRQRQLAKLAAKRQAERRHKQRQRVLAGVIAGVVALAGIGVAIVALTGGDDEPSSSGTPTTPPPTSSPSAPVGNVACGGTAPEAASTVSKFNNKYPKPPKMTIDTSATYVATMKTSCGTITIELDAKEAPDTVNSLVFLAKQHYFDGIFFHRVVPGFVIQGGDPTGSGTGGPGYKTVDDPGKGAKYPVGTLAMAKGATEPNGTSGSQFFIVTDASAQQALAPGGVGQYAIVGMVTAGMDAVDKIAAIPVGGPSGDTPTQKAYIESVTISVK